MTPIEYCQAEADNQLQATYSLLHTIRGIHYLKMVCLYYYCKRRGHAKSECKALQKKNAKPMTEATPVDSSSSIPKEHTSQGGGLVRFK